MWFEWFLLFVLIAIAVGCFGITLYRSREPSTIVGLFFALLALGTWFFILNQGG